MGTSVNSGIRRKKRGDKITMYKKIELQSVFRKILGFYKRQFYIGLWI